LTAERSAGDAIDERRRSRRTLADPARLETFCDDLSIFFTDLPPEDGADARLFEWVLSELSARFIDLAPGVIDATIVDGLEAIAAFMGADRCSIFDRLPDRAEFQVRHSWASAESEPLAVVESTELPSLTAALLRGECVMLRSLDALPEAARAEGLQLASLGLRSILFVPLRVSGAIVGSLAVMCYRRERAWPPLMAQRLRLLGEVLANASERQRGQAELQRLRDELAHVARTITMGSISTSIAHEVNQPLCAILSNAQSTARLLTNKTVRPQLLHEALEDIANDARRASEVVARIRSLGKRSAFRRQPLSLNDVTREVLPLVRDELIRRSVSLELALADSLPQVQGDRVQLQQVVLNLIVNSAEALERVPLESRTLTLRTSSSEDGLVTLQVEDSGPGLDESSLEQVFEAFFTTKPQGMGLGLAISRSIIDAHHGRLWASRGADPGTTFHVSLPAMQEVRS
jgi:signal transduction histidine kinase